jgi:hypothetical protein
MREMERRKRVEMMMNSRLFREELERIIETQMKDGSGPSGLLQQISEMMGPQGARFNTNVFKSKIAGVIDFLFLFLFFFRSDTCVHTISFEFEIF